MVAMGLTFIAFEGYDLIATVSEEIKDPKRNIPKATFTSLAIAVTIYLLIILVSIGAVDVTSFGDIFGKQPAELSVPGAHVLDPADPAINTVWEVLGIYKETGIVRAAENFMPAVGVLIIVFGGLLSTMSALNATVLASSRVAFSMGRERMLPAILSTIHPVRRTPHVAVLVSGFILIVLAIALPVEVVGSAASVLFLLSFALVNASLILIRRREPELAKSYKVPFFPWLPILGIVINLALAVYQFSFHPDRLDSQSDLDCRRRRHLYGLHSQPGRAGGAGPDPDGRGARKAGLLGDGTGEKPRPGAPVEHAGERHRL